jgi:hypothetical protein
MRRSLGGSREEMAAILEVLVPDQPQVRFVHQRRGLQRLARLFLSEPLGR